ncbi:MAG: RnfABCDGE type electron transport complex subunit D, partial [Endozoicomonas sp.]
MKSLRKCLDSIEPYFVKGGKYEKFYALFEAADTLLYTPLDKTHSTSHIRDAIDLKRMMGIVWLCTFPAMFFGMWNVGYQANIAIADGLSAPSDWHGMLIAMLAGNDPASVLDNMIYGAVYFLPIYAVTFCVGGFWEVLFATV